MINESNWLISAEKAKVSELILQQMGGGNNKRQKKLATKLERLVWCFVIKL
jgi:hypothetical protein